VKRETRIFVQAFLQGFTCAGLFRRLEIPGAPTHLFDTRSVEEVVASGEFEEHIREAKRVSGKTFPR